MARSEVLLATGTTGAPNCRNDPDIESRGRRSLRDSRFQARFSHKATARAVGRPGPRLRLWLGPGPLQARLGPAARNRQPAARRSRFRAGRPRTTRKSREKRPPREITGPNRRFLDGPHGNYSARTCSSSPRPEKIKHRAALARRQAKGGPPERQKFHLILLKILNLQ